MDEYRYNKGASFNAGFDIIREKFPECDYVALHDVDILPLTDEVSYAYPREAVYHAIPPGFHPVPLYHDETFIGGILLMPK
ncbi:Beta-1,4-galactosyltransferase 7 [Sarracenia purpurea var. burkii]